MHSRMGEVTPRFYPLSTNELQRSLGAVGLAGDFDFIYNDLRIENCRMLSTITRTDIDKATKQGTLKGTFEQYEQIFMPALEKCTYASADCDHMSVEDHTAELVRKLDKHASKSQDVLDAEESAAEMNDDIFLADEVLGQGNDFFAKVEAKAKAEAKEQAEVGADMNLALVEAEDALRIKLFRVDAGSPCTATRPARRR